MLQDGYLNFLFIYWKSSSDLPCSSVGVVFGCFSDIFTLNVIFWVFFWVQDLVLCLNCFLLWLFCNVCKIPIFPLSSSYPPAVCLYSTFFFSGWVLFLSFVFPFCFCFQSCVLVSVWSLHPASVFVSSWCFCSHVLFLLLLFWCLFFFLYLVPNSTSSVLSSEMSPSWALACSLASRYPVCILLILSFLHFAHSFHKLSNKAAFYFIPHSRVLPAKMFHDIKM